MANHTDDILTRFNHGITWNGITYLMYKVLTTSVTFLLFARLSTNNFVTWTSLQSLVYLIILWLDGGLRKSIPRYLPLFEQHAHALERRIRLFFLLYACVLASAAFLFFWFSPRIANFLHITYNHHVFIIASILICLEGTVALLRLIFHAQFKNKIFNVMSTLVLAAQAGTIIILIISHWPITLLQIFLLQAAASCIIIFFSFRLLAKNQALPLTSTELPPRLVRSFFIHSGIMWMNTSIKSLSERNVMVPLIAHILGPTSAALYKIAQDSALLVHRLIVKTLGTNDTSLLTYSTHHADSITLLPINFNKLAHKVIILCTPLLGLLLLGFIAVHSSGNFWLLWFFSIPPSHSFEQVSALFFILTAGYLCETLFSPFERILEVQHQYKRLFIAYTPYILVLVWLVSVNPVWLNNIILFVGVLQAVRLISALLMVLLVNKTYQRAFPWKTLAKYLVYMGGCL